MADVQSVPVAELEELLDNEIPCSGWGTSTTREVSCDRPAVLHGSGHGCGSDNPRRYKCIQCWQAWFMETSSRPFRCTECHQVFVRASDFSDYRPF